MAGILVGTIWGVMTGPAMLGVLCGTGIGIVLSIAVWLIDRHRLSRHPPRRPDYTADTVDRL